MSGNDWDIQPGDVVMLEYRRNGKLEHRHMLVTKVTRSSVCGHPEGAPAVIWRVERYRVVGWHRKPAIDSVATPPVVSP